MNQGAKKNRRTGDQRIQAIRDTMTWMAGEDAAALGKMPPQDTEMEMVVIGAAMLDQAGRSIALGILKPQHFYLEKHSRIWQAITELSSIGEPVDIITVTHKLRSNGDIEMVGGPLYISQLTNRVASGAHLESHCRILLQFWMKREVIRISRSAERDAFDDTTDSIALADSVQTQYLQVFGELDQRSSQTAAQLLPKIIDRVEINRQGTGVTGVPSGYYEIDKVTGGWQRNNMIILAGRPGMGKTSLVLNFMYRAALWYDQRVMFFSLEMTSEQLMLRMLAMATGATNHRLNTGELHEHEIKMIYSKKDVLSSRNLIIDDTPSLTPVILRAKALRQKHLGGLDMIIVDYMQLMESGQDHGGNDNKRVSDISRSLKMIAKDLDVPVIALSQLSRETEKRGNGRPKLSDLRDSGAIEQDADLVGFVYRPSLYQKHDSNGNPIEERDSELIIAKNRHGAILDIYLHNYLKVNRWFGRTATTEMERSDVYGPVPIDTHSTHSTPTQNEF
jgi:replicative DNA helicase